MPDDLRDADADTDLLVEPHGAASEWKARYCTGPIVAWSRTNTPGGGLFYHFDFEAGGALELYTDRPAIWIHPEPH